MVKIKGQKISNKLAKDSIKAMERLIYLYKNPDEFEECSLCSMIEATCVEDCDCCPWAVLTGEKCWENDYYFRDVVECDDRRKSRIRQLYYWRSIYKKALNDGGIKI